MGSIVEGAVSGKLPESVAFAVNYPGYPSSVANAIRTLGGEEGLEKARKSEANFLELRFRPEDPYAHPAFGELRHTSDLLLRLSRKAARASEKLQTKSSAANSCVEDAGCEEVGQSRRVDEESKSPGGEVEAAIVARVDQTYVFDGMADYQYVVAVHASASNKRKGAERRSVNDKPGVLPDIKNEETMILVPPLFSVKDMPEEIFLRQPSAKKKPAVLAIEGAPPAAAEEENPVPCFALDFKIQRIPPKGNWELKLARGSEPWLRTAALVRLFQERPIWTKSMLNERLMEQDITVTDFYLRSLLFRIAYYFGCGPFRNFWIRNGYDPRLDPESRAHQMIDFREPPILRGRAEGSAPTQGRWKSSDMCAFKCIPEKKFTQFQLIDLQDDDIQAQIECPPERTSCSESTGWFRLSTIKRLRRIVRVRFLALYPGDVARGLEASERKSLERSKFEADANDEEDRPIDRGTPDLNTNRVPTSGLSESCEMGEVGIAEVKLPGFSAQDESSGVDLNANEDEDDEEEDEEEEEYIEDDVDQEEGGLKTIGEDDEEEEEEMEDQQSQEGIPELEENSILQGLEHPADSIPKNYLQALLGKFSFKSDGSEGSRAVNLDDDGEYTIYEQDEDEDEDEDDDDDN